MNKMINSIDADVIRPYWEEITEYRNKFDISSTGKATIAVVLYAYDVDTIKVEANLQQYKNGQLLKVGQMLPVIFTAV